jgi:hypothetical protein
MKKLYLILILWIVFVNANSQPGKYAGTKKSLIGKVYTDSRNIPGLKGWTFMEGSLMNNISDPEQILADVFKRGTTWIVVLSIKEDTASQNARIMDIIEVTGVAKGWAVRTSDCSLNNVLNPYIIVWGKETTGEYMNILKKAWKFDPDKRRILQIPVKGIKCENIGC